MISVIIPTIWAYEPFLNFLQYVVELPVIGEVILINNRVELTPDHPVLNHWKLKHHKMPENIYVNPAWNLGVSLAQFDKLCILNDDVLVDLRVFFEADKFVSKDIGILAIGTTIDTYNLHQKRYDEIHDISRLEVTGNIKINEQHLSTGLNGAGTLFFLHKDNWIPIPDILKIHFGDNWQHNLQIKFGRKNYYLNDCFYYTPYSVSIHTGIAQDYQTSTECCAYENYDYYRSLIDNFNP